MLRTGPSVQDTVGELLDSDGNSITVNDNGFLLLRREHFLIRRKLAVGAWYVKVSSPEDRALYSFSVETVTEPGSTIADAQVLDIAEVGAGRIDPSTDADYFKINLAKATHVFARAVSNTVDIDGALLDDMGDPVATNLFEQDFEAGGPMGFVWSDRLEAGTHYIKVTRSAATARRLRDSHGRRRRDEAEHGALYRPHHCVQRSVPWMPVASSEPGSARGNVGRGHPGRGSLVGGQHGRRDRGCGRRRRPARRPPGPDRERGQESRP